MAKTKACKPALLSCIIMVKLDNARPQKIEVTLKYIQTIDENDHLTTRDIGI